jgi:hypothetical protein
MRTTPDVALAKEASSPEVYLVVGDTKFWITDPVEFADLGFMWAKVRVVPDGALAHLTQKSLSAGPATRPSDIFFDCGEDYDAFDGKHYFNCHSSSHLVGRFGDPRSNVLVAGWLKRYYVNAAGHGVEDVFYDLFLDSRFLERMYGPEGVSNALVGAQYWGNPRAPLPVPFADGTEVTCNSWTLPWSAFEIHGELNAWHQSTTGGLWTSHWEGRGPAPAGWVNPLAVDRDAWFPFVTHSPDGRYLVTGAYVVMRGVLWQDHGHPPTDPFGGWLEMHPVDWVVHALEPSPSARQTVASITAAGGADPGDVFVSVNPDFAPRRGAAVQPRRIRVVHDQRRWATPGALQASTTTQHADRIDVAVTVAPASTYKGSWVVEWREVRDRDELWVNDGPPAGAQLAGDGETWTWTNDEPGPYIGSAAHRSSLIAGFHQHYFWGASAPVVVSGGNELFTMIYLDPDDPPEQVMLQWHSDSWEHRAFWGDDRLGWGVLGTPSRWRVDTMPYSGEWVRLHVPAHAVGLVGHQVDGMAYTLFGGRATWDYSGIHRSLGRMMLTAEPDRVVGGRTADLTIHAADTVTGQPVAGRVFRGSADVGATNLVFRRYHSAQQTYAYTVRATGYETKTISIYAESPTL